MCSLLPLNDCFSSSNGCSFNWEGRRKCKLGRETLRKLPSHVGLRISVDTYSWLIIGLSESMYLLILLSFKLLHPSQSIKESWLSKTDQKMEQHLSMVTAWLFVSISCLNISPIVFVTQKLQTKIITFRVPLGFFFFFFHHKKRNLTRMKDSARRKLDN